MPNNLRDLLAQKRSDRRPVDPIAIFEGLSLRSSNVAELWRPQSDALREWHAARDREDVLFKLKTGAGKTLLGLLAAQSLVNETLGKVLYVCATNQLLEQTRAKAEEYGLETSVYYGGSWEGAAYDTATGPGLTNYHAVFNGKSVFRREDLAAVVFDDAHTAHGIIRDQFTLRISKGRFPEIYTAVVELARTYFEGAGRGVQFADVADEGRDPSVILVPAFVSAPAAETIRQILVEHGVDEETELLFAWEYLKGNLENCAFLFDRSCVEFTPIVTPVHVASPFRAGVRRLYLSATLPDDDLFCRTFGRFPDLAIEPGGRAGDTERMILLPDRDIPDDATRRWAKSLVADKKTLIMVPSFESAENWTDVAEVFESAAGHERVRQFAASESEKLVLVARYDGVDLPGDDCRLMVVDGLPLGNSLLERYFENHLEVGGISDASIASRVVQLLGRISRGMADYGVVVLLGRRLRRWLDSPRNRQRVPRMIQMQLELADMLVARYGDFSPSELVDGCLQRRADWLDLYDGVVQPEPDPERGQPRAMPEGARVPDLEHTFGKELWRKDYAEAGAALDRLRPAVFEASRPMGGWYLHWQGHCLSMVGEAEVAEDLFRQAARVSRELGQRPAREIGNVDKDADVSPEARRITDLLMKRGPTAVTLLHQTATTLRGPCSDLDPESGISTAQQEEATRLLGEWLGLTTSRPDNDLSTGPDVLWELRGGHWLLLELKTGKSGASYNKDEIGQLHDHVQWALDQGATALNIAVVGPRLPTTPNANPPEGALVIAPETLASIADAVALVLESALKQNLPLFRIPTVQKGLVEAGLLEQGVLTALGGAKLEKL